MNTKTLFADEKIQKVPLHPSLKLSVLVGERISPAGIVLCPESLELVFISSIITAALGWV